MYIFAEYANQCNTLPKAKLHTYLLYLLLLTLLTYLLN